MNNKIAFDGSDGATIYFRVNRNSVPKTLVVTSNSLPYNLLDAGFSFRLRVKSNPQSSTFLIDKALTISGADSNRVALSVTDTETDIKPRTYFLEIYEETNKHTWISADFIGHEGRFDSFTDSADLTVSIGGEDINIEVIGEQPSGNIDGGTWDSVYLPEQVINGGTF